MNCPAIASFEQYKLFNYHFTSYEVDIKVIDTAMEEELFPGVNVLYLPEEYIDNKRKFYKRFLDGSKHYDYIFGHLNIIRIFPLCSPENTSAFSSLILLISFMILSEL